MSPQEDHREQDPLLSCATEPPTGIDADAAHLVCGPEQDVRYRDALDGRTLQPASYEFEDGEPLSWRAYPFTNEYLPDATRAVSHDGKRVAGIAGSGDYLITALMEGASHVAGLDASIYSCLWTEFKMGLLACHERDTFLAFYSPWLELAGNDVCASVMHELYCPVRASLSETAQGFFDHILQSPELKLGTGYAFREHLQAMNPPATRSIPYLKDDEAYHRAQTAVIAQQVPLHLGDASSLCDVCDSADILYISNVLEWRLKTLDLHSARGVKRSIAGIQETVLALTSTMPPDGALLLTGPHFLDNVLPRIGLVAQDINQSPCAMGYHDPWTVIRRS